ncbi:aspartic ase NANA, chloroplast-like [Olea europaea subsp. europaea]|uniref:Aspartic ase NANA, chloroplast-like n=2 Tax=Olea europaea subsp. europaea TaxID=158383 RepID=A0A8S0SGP0_OLEEU|nr:aspartic ase NANA, chloroplast-like [Olea europaea subsp. europaea]
MQLHVQKIMVTRTRKGDLFLLPFLLYVAISSAKFSQGHEHSFGTKFELIHRHSLKRNQNNVMQHMTRLEHIKLLLHRDITRQRAISQRRGLKHASAVIRRQVRANTRVTNDRNASGKLPMHSGADYGIGEYFVSFKVGTPAQRFMLIADTGSDLTWMKCRYKCQGATCNQTSSGRGDFHPDRSSSFRTIPCSSRMCKIELANLFSLAHCPSPLSPCAYDFSYSDGSEALGLFAQETVTIRLTNGRTARLNNVLVGCTESSHGTFETADGVIGLGYRNYSFTLKAAEKFGGKFSYCLVDHLSPKNVSSYLVFGNDKQATATPPDKMLYTELLLGKINSFYAVNIKDISIGGTMLQIPPQVWNVNSQGGVILDSGSSLTFLTQPAYQPVMAALKHSLSNFSKSKLDIEPMDYCFNSTGFNESMVPKLEFHFADGATFEAPVKSYVIDAAEEVKCLGIVSASWPGTSIIGNIMQQNHIWEFDLINKRLGFARSSCT